MKKSNRKKASRALGVIVIVLLAGVMLFAGWKIVAELSDRQRAIDTFDELAEIAYAAPTTVSELPETPTEEREEPTEAPTEAAPAATHKRDIAALRALNADCVGWLSIADTTLDYPVVHTPRQPQKYLRLGFYGDYSYSGVPFLDGRNSLTDDALIIFGHNMKNNTMFSALCDYLSEDFAEEHPVIEFETEAGCVEYAVFAVLLVRENDPLYAFQVAENAEDYAEKITQIQEKSLYYRNISPQYGQQLLVLSTCYGDSDGRLLVIAVASPGE